MASTSGIFLPVASRPPGDCYKVEEAAFPESTCQAQGKHSRQRKTNSVGERQGGGSLIVSVPGKEAHTAKYCVVP